MISMISPDGSRDIHNFIHRMVVESADQGFR